MCIFIARSDRRIQRLETAVPRCVREPLRYVGNGIIT